MVCPITIQKITDEYNQEAKALILNGFLERFGFIDERFNPDLNRILIFYSQEGRVFLVALLDGELVGTGALVKEDETTGRIVRMSVKKTERRKGVAGDILRRLEQHANKEGYRNLVLETNKDWESAIRFYQKMGFHAVTTNEEQMHFIKEISPDSIK